MLMSIIEALLLFGVGFLLGGHLILKMVHSLAEQELIRRGIVTKPEDGSGKLLNMELINNIYYIFDSKTNTFVCQGNTLEDIFKILMNSGVQNALVSFEQKRFIIKNGLVLELSA